MGCEENFKKYAEEVFRKQITYPNFKVCSLEKAESTLLKKSWLCYIGRGVNLSTQLVVLVGGKSVRVSVLSIASLTHTH